MVAKDALLRVGDTCCALEAADQAAVLIDNQAYFTAAAQAIRNARASIWVLGWEFDPRTALNPGQPRDQQDAIGPLLKQIGKERPQVRIRVLVWDAALPLAAGKHLMPQRAQFWFAGSPVEFRLDATVPKGAAHHQKLLIVDDSLAFCSGTDFSPNRWDRAEHFDEDPDRVDLSGNIHPPRHAATFVVSGPAAKAAADLARGRWERCTGERISPPRNKVPNAPWPCDGADFEAVRIGLSRTFPKYRNSPEVRENEALYLAAIRAARKVLYFENQYFSSSVLGEALAARLDEPEGPEIVVINGEHAASSFDHATMDPSRDALVHKLHEADRFGRFHIYAPHSPEGATILMHSKLMIVDDRFIRVGSSNIADRSLGYDSECDLAIHLSDRHGQRAAISHILHRLISHFVGVSVVDVAERLRTESSLASAIDALDRNDSRRLRPLSTDCPTFPRSIVSQFHLGDPHSSADAWRPWVRGRA